MTEAVLIEATWEALDNEELRPGILVTIEGSGIAATDPYLHLKVQYNRLPVDSAAELLRMALATLEEGDTE